jgi:DNA-binding response OmpR family regulator
MMRPRVRPQQRPIIVGEDNYLTARLIAAALSKSNRTVVVARDGDEVLDLVAKYEPDLLLLNMNISRPNGVQVLREVQDNSPRLQILAFSQSGQAELRQNAQGLGVSYFETPFHPVELADRVRLMLTTVTS